VLSGQGVDPSAPSAGHRAIVAAARRALEEASRLVRPVVMTTRVSWSDVQAGSGISEGLARRLEGATELVACACTIGPAVEARARSLEADDLVAALAFDGLGSAAVGRLAAQACAAAAKEVAGRGLAATPPISPGLAGWPLDLGQRFIFSRLDPARIGITLTSAAQMVPRKSLSFVLGIGEGVAAGTACELCGMTGRCRYRHAHA
jgi:hypothetical protein